MTTKQTSEKVTRRGFYPVADRVGFERADTGPRHFAAQWTGEKRPPRQGEWYLSGAIVAAYRAAADLSTPHLIARLVEVETVRRVRRVVVPAAIDNTCNCCGAKPGEPCNADCFAEEGA